VQYGEERNICRSSGNISAFLALRYEIPWLYSANGVENAQLSPKSTGLWVMLKVENAFRHGREM
jgi:hypothetical protein